MKKKYQLGMSCVIDPAIWIEHGDEGVRKLLIQLHPNIPREDICRLIGSVLDNNGYIFHANDCSTDPQELIGMATLIIAHKMSGAFGLVEDVVIDEKYRGRGIGTLLMKNLINFGREKEIRYLDLTSAPRRVAANRLYQKLSFKRRGTNSYRYDY